MLIQGSHPGTLVEANGTRLYVEKRGAGPTVLFVPGAGGDAELFAATADALAGEFTVVTYDRRANSRSDRPAVPRPTSTEEQADDAAALLTALGATPAAVFGTSSGAAITLQFILRHPSLCRGAILHEPALLATLADPVAIQSQFAPLISLSETAGPEVFIERFLRLVGGDRAFDQLGGAPRARVLSNGITLAGSEVGKLDTFIPDASALARNAVPCQVMAGAGGAPFLKEMAQWLATRLGVPVVESPGAHMCYLDHPRELAEALRPFLRKASPRW
jgi:pimeloyl-ACP methyl ester carboxylesterase